MIFTDNTIEKRVMQVVKAKIKTAQAEYDSGVKELEEKLEREKESLMEKLVHGIVGKFL